MKKRVPVLIVMILLLLVAISLVIIYKTPQYTSFVVKGTTKQVQFYFFDENNCSLNGYLFNGNKLIGKTQNGIFNLTYDYYKEEINLDRDINLFGKLGNCSNDKLYFDKSWEVFQIPEYYFLGDSVFKFRTTLDSHNPSKRELIGFIQPSEVRGELYNVGVKRENPLDDLSMINNYLNEKVTYVDDWNFNNKENYWQTPTETLKLGQGDCEDYSTTLLSMFLAYNSSLNCFNVIFSSHVTTLCYVGEYYIYYDQEKTELRKRIRSRDIETNSRLRSLKKEYFEHYGLNESDRAYYAFDNHRYIEFKTDEDFIIWQSALYGVKQQGDLFDELEKEWSGINITIPEPEEEVIELANAPQQELPSLRGFVTEYSTILILLGSISILLIIILIWIGIRH